MPEAGDIETIDVPIEARVIVKNSATVDKLHETHVTSGSTTNSPVKNLVEGAFGDEPQLPEADKQPTRKRGKLSKLKTDFVYYYSDSLDEKSTPFCKLLMSSTIIKPQ